MKEDIDEAVEAERVRHIRALEEVLREHDVCAHVILAGRAGRFELFDFLEASWCRLKMEALPDGGHAIRLRSKAADYGGDKEGQKQQLEWTVGVASGFGLMGGEAAMSWIRVAEQFDKATGVEHTPMRKDDPRDKP